MKTPRIRRFTAAALAVAALASCAEREKKPAALASYDRWDPETVEIFNSLPVQEEGRLKPVETVARYKLLRLYGAKRLRVTVTGEDKPIKLSAGEWLLDCLFRPEVAKQIPVFKVNNPAVMDNIGVKPHASPRERYTYGEINIPEVRERLQELTAKYQAILSDPDREEEGKILRRDPVKAGVLSLKSQLNEFEWTINAFNFARDGLGVDLGEISDKFPKTGTGKTPISTFIEQFDAIIAAARAPGGDELIQQLSGAFGLLERDTATAGVKDKTSITSLAMFPPIDSEDEEWVKPGYLIERLSFRSNEFQPGEKEQFTAWAMPKIKSLERLAAAVGDDAAFRTELAGLRDLVVAKAEERGEHRKIELELFNNRAGFFHWALGFFFLAFLMLSFTWLAPASGFAKVGGIGAWLMMLVATVALITGITVRCMILSRPPIATLYETILFITATAVLLCLAVEKIDRRRMALAVAAVLGLGGMFLAMRFEIKEGKDTLKVLEAVLRSNFWLSTHVITINIGYMAALVAGAIAHIYIFCRLVKIGSRDFMRSVTRMVYGVTCFGLLFSLVGTVLGGVWANDSWGRFWGWDPKENGALMICLGALILLHARMGGYIRDLGINMCAVIIAVITVFSWWHVNQLETGLHSYGFTSGIMFWLYTVYAIEGWVLLFGVFVFFRDRRQTSGSKASTKPPEDKKKLSPEPA